ncbi:PDZ domain-containing protein [Virgibacillus necropolis]|uniref:PDZ domain-containing protein n=1 Tax=Virgibacillus necropolis TaxID=163877 RepID=A0A221MI55_9BACI|nr:PDZ domain-containing protein [Virgibacillus necropolis]ASN07321.1 PDZ domain-containing protein [Virgibacillus necropolis]
MVEAWGIEIIKGIGKLFLNPLTYWIFILFLFAGLRRIRKERTNFGVKIFNVFSEWKGTGFISIIAGILVSGICIGVGIMFSYETLALICLVSILLSLTLRFTLLSPSYTIGITLLVLLFIPTIIENQSYVDTELFTDLNFVGFSILIGLFLLVEAFLTYRIKRREAYPDLALGSRGKWIGLHHLRKLSIIPFFTLVPTGLITPFASYWPHISVGGETYSLLLIPFIIGFNHSVKSILPEKAAKQLGKKIGVLGILVLVLAVGSIYFWGLSIVAAILAILGREFISYKHRVMDSGRQSYFSRNLRGLTVIAIIPNTPADRLEIQIGETINKVNGKRIRDVNEFYYFLQKSGAFFKLEVLDLAGEVRLLQSAFYQNDHHELGLIFVKDKYPPSACSKSR